jgi:tetratricopeptide (TPR) repeat protein
MYPEPRQTAFDLQNVGNRLLNSSQVERAIDVYNLHLKLFPESSNANENLAIAYLKMGNQELAKKHCEKALELNSLNKSAKETMEKM